MTSEVTEELTSDEFWSHAFRADDPLRLNYEAGFRRGIVEGQEDELAWARLAIYALVDKALLPVLARLISLAVDMPGAEFVESLAFFVSEPRTVSRLEPHLEHATPEARDGLVRDISSLRDKLKNRGDPDLADRFAEIHRATSREQQGRT
jgi:hypothetical protein